MPETGLYASYTGDVGTDDVGTLFVCRSLRTAMEQSLL